MEAPGSLGIGAGASERLAIQAWRPLLECMSEGVSVSDPDGLIIYSNPAEHRIFGYSPGALIGQPVSVLSASPRVDHARRAHEVTSQLQSGGVWRGEWPSRRKDGSLFSSAVRITVVEFDGKTHWLWVREAAASAGNSSEALRASEARLELAAAAAGLGIWDWDVRTGRFVYSPRAREMCGFLPDQEITLEDVRAVTHPDDLPRTSAQSQMALDPSIRANDPYEYRLLRPDGTVRYVLAFGRATFEQVDGEVRATRYVGTLQDITERRRLEAATADSAQRLRLALEASRMAVWEMDLRTDELEGSPELNRILGLPPDARPTADELRARYYPGERERLREIGQAALARGDRFIDAEYRHVLPSGALRWLHLRCELTLEDGVPVRAVGVLSDVTERKHAELRNSVLAELSARIRDVQDPVEVSYIAAEILGTALGVSRVGYGTIDKAAETISIERDWNAPGIRSLAGVLRFRDYGSYIDDLKRGETVLFADAREDPRTAATAAALEAISARSVVNMPVTEDGGFVALLFLNHAAAREWSEAELALIREAADQTRVAVERRRAERELRDLNARLEERVQEALAQRKLWADIFESSHANIAAWDFRQTFIALNRPYQDAFQQIYGVRPQVGDNLAGLFASKPEQLAEVQAVFERALSGQAFFIRSEFGDPALERRSYDLQFSPLLDRDGQLIGAFHYGLDVSERVATEKRLADAEAALRQSQKMEAIGQLTGGVAHDFNNLLTPIVGGLDMLQRRLVADERAQRLIGGALASAERAQTLVQRLLAFARRQPLQPVPVDIAAVATGMSDLLASTVGPTISISFEVSDETSFAIADANQLEMAVLNLAVNARDAMPAGGALSVGVRRAALGADDRVLKAGEYVVLSVADTGAGMDPDTMSRAVEPFFSTKGIGKGTGLGLSMAHGLAAQLGGALRLFSTVGRGTRVELWLPASHEAPREAGEVEEIATPGRAGAVLLVEDEEFVRASTAEMLAELGFSVAEADSAETALDLLATGLRTDVVLTDHLMPGMTGAELARVLRERRPELPVLIMSGYADVQGVPADLPRLTKPFRQADLARSLAALGAARL